MMYNSAVFVFGSNEAGIHGRGAAIIAKADYGAMQGYPEGIQGDSYAIPTKDKHLHILPISTIKRYVDTFLAHAAGSNRTYFVTRVGCGLAGYQDAQIAPLFQGASDNVLLPPLWLEILNEEG